MAEASLSLFVHGEKIVLVFQTSSTRQTSPFSCKGLYVGNGGHVVVA